MARGLSTRASAARILMDVLVDNVSLDAVIQIKSEHLPTNDASLCKALCYGVMRHFPSLSATINPLLTKPLKQKDQDIYALLLIGAYQLSYMRVPEYAAIDSCVEGAKSLKKNWGAGLVNAVLRRYQRESESLSTKLKPFAKVDHPKWLYQKIHDAWTDNADAIFEQNNQQPPLCIRVNIQKTTRDAYVSLLEEQGIQGICSNYSEVGVYLPEKPQDITALPGFLEGLCSVQDEAPQLCAQLLDLRPGQTVLDACAAPGGKTCHLLEAEPGLKRVVAVDIEPGRLDRIEENLERLQLQAEVICADILNTESWWDGEPFDRILLDAPCSATGVIRRHPDIKLLRKPADIAALARLQLHMLETLWPCLKPGGLLLYATCSILPEENADIIQQFCEKEPSCQALTIDANYGIVSGNGRQLFPQQEGHDGFYYASLQKGE